MKNYILYLIGNGFTGHGVSGSPLKHAMTIFPVTGYMKAINRVVAVIKGKMKFTNLSGKTEDLHWLRGISTFPAI